MDRLQSIKLIVCDLDGTLLHDDKTMDTKILNVLSRKKIPFTIVSGRNGLQVEKYIKALNIELPYICNNGADAFIQDRCCYRYYIPQNSLQLAVQYIQKNKISMILNTSKGIYVYGHDPLIKIFSLRSLGLCPIYQNVPLDNEILAKVYKVVFACEDIEKIENVSSQIRNDCPDVHCIRSEGTGYTITHKHATKGNGVRWLLSKLNIQTKDVIAFGDNFNDISMLKEAGVRVAVANAQPMVKCCADYITKTNNEDGVSYFIEEYLNR